MKFYAGIGSRETPAFIWGCMQARALILASQGYTLRSGAATGADFFFERGALEGHGSTEIYLPWRNYNKHPSTLLPTPEAFLMAEQFHPAWHQLSRGGRCLHARNSHIIMGADLKTPVEFVLFWTRDGKASGGTGQALRIAQHYGIPTELITDSCVENPTQNATLGSP